MSHTCLDMPESSVYAMLTYACLAAFAVGRGKDGAMVQSGGERLTEGRERQDGCDRAAGYRGAISSLTVIIIDYEKKSHPCAL